MRVALVLSLGIAVGGILVSGWYSIPNQEDSYTIQTKERCLTDDGVSFKLRYNGRGVVAFKVVPPQPAALAEKGLKK